MAMTKQPDGIKRQRADLEHPPQHYKILLRGSPIGQTRRVARGSRAWWADPLDGRPWERFSNHTMAAEYLAAPSQMPVSTTFGRSFHPADTSVAVAPVDPFTVDPDLVNRGNRGHALTLNALAAYLESRGLAPVEPGPADPLFDLAWIRDEACFVAEIKSVTNANEEHQLRLGLGQLLRYRHALTPRFASVVPILVLERQPSDPEWQKLCASIGVHLEWPPDFAGLDEGAAASPWVA